MPPLVSVVIPVYNTADFLEKCVGSLTRQTYSHLEIICINDGSKDASLAVLEKLAADDSRIQVVNQPNQGVSRARNAGLELATGAFLIFIDSDDWVEADYVEVLLRLIQQDNADVSLCGFRGGGETFLERDELYLPENAQAVELFERIMIQTPIAKMYRRSIIEANGLRFDPELHFGEDYVFTLSYFSYCKLVKATKRVLYHYHIGTPNSLSKQYSIRRFQDDEVRAVLAEDLFKTWGLKPIEYKPYVDGLYYWAFYDCIFYLYNNLQSMEKTVIMDWIEKILAFKFVKEELDMRNDLHPIMNCFKSRNSQKIYRFLRQRKMLMGFISKVTKRR